MLSLDQQIAHAVQHIRNALDSAPTPSFHFEITVSGRLLGGDALLEYKMRKSCYDTPVVGSNFYAVVDEFARREGWNKTFAPLALASPEAYKLTEEYNASKLASYATEHSVFNEYEENKKLA